MKTQFTVLLLLISFSIQSQNYKFGKVSEEELAQTFDSNDSTIGAIMLYRKHRVDFEYRENNGGFMQKVEVHQRIKILNKEGLKWATNKVRLYNRSNASSERFQSLKGYTFNLVDGDVTKDKLKNDGVFDEEANKYWRYKSFTMPNVKVGSIVEFTYEILSPFIQIDEIDIQTSIPTKVFELKVSTPEYFVYNKLLNPRASYIPKLDVSSSNVTIPFSYSLDVISADLKDVPALKDEPFVNNIDNYKSKLIMELSMTRMPRSNLEYYSTSWDKVTERIYQNPDFGDQLDKSSYYKDDVDAILAGVTDPVEKSFLIFNYVKSKINWNDFYGYTSENGARKAYKDGVGNVADINLMLISMLRYAGLRANPVLVSTKNNGIPLFPTRQGFDYVICMIENEVFNVLLDATEDYSTYNVLPTRVLNWQGRVIRENGSSAWINLSPLSLSTDVTSLNVKINPDLTIEGKVRQQKTDYVAMNYRNRYANLSTDEHIKSIERNNGELEIMDIEIENNKDYTKPLKLTYDYNLADGIEEIGENLYFSPMLFFASEENPFKQETRNFPIDLTYPFSDKYMINIMIPEGYAIESLPQSEKIQFNDAGDFTYLAKQNGSFLQLTVSLNMKTSIILAQDYETFKGFYSKVIEKQSEKIVLKKI
ncbi:DUF3857 domain-containing protein [Psychroserpens algicola]|uniref:DUF3857 domain-containing protein n=1 Tax=Psychroserpens algicola TaxID=1719034 RepID=A0ABT0H900_9FLAO|nr:DUF3857 domain-containing protein [Psychroserpens algicola]MCK8480844.1 DUF3857 domain-containing protein [Psychroserpens algicola]